jgi:hypothetical protein
MFQRSSDGCPTAPETPLGFIDLIVRRIWDLVVGLIALLEDSLRRKESGILHMTLWAY